MSPRRETIQPADLIATITNHRVGNGPATSPPPITSEMVGHTFTEKINKIQINSFSDLCYCHYHNLITLFLKRRGDLFKMS